MSKKKISTKVDNENIKTETAPVDVSVNDIEVDGDLYWEGLVDIRNDIVKEILTQQQLVLELSKKYEVALKKNPSTYAAVEGLMKSIQDLAADLPPLMQRHQVNGVFKTGDVKASGDIDDTLEYLDIGSQYIAINENLSNLISTAYLDIFAKLSLPISDLAQTIKDGKVEVENTIKGAINGK